MKGPLTTVSFLLSDGLPSSSPHPPLILSSSSPPSSPPPTALVEPSFPEGFVLSFPMRTNYMYGLVRKEITEMYAFTACLWLKAKEGGIGTPFSYSVPGQTNELVLLQGVRSPVELLINDKVAHIYRRGLLYSLSLKTFKRNSGLFQDMNVFTETCINVRHQTISH